MVNLITGSVAVAMIIIFLGYYAITLQSIPLWIIIAGVLIMVVVDFYQSLRQRDD